MEEKVKVPIWKKTWLIVLACIFIPPLGLALLWIGKKGGKVSRIVLTVVLGIYSIIWLGGIVGGNNENTATNTNTTSDTEVVEDQTTADTSGTDSSSEESEEVAEASPEEVAAAYKAACVELPYDELARFPDRNVGKALVLTGEIIQVMEEDSQATYRLKLNDDYDQIVLVGYAGGFDQGQILEGDNISFWGEYLGTYTYTSTMGGEITVPSLNAMYYLIN